MSRSKDVLSRVEPFVEMVALLLDAAASRAVRVNEAFRLRYPSRKGATLRPGRDTPLWNQLRTLVRSYLRRRGAQAQLGRILGLPRQRVNEYVTRGGHMPDAERALQLLVWVAETRAGRRPK